MNNTKNEPEEEPGLRSPEITEIISRPPSWLLRWGASLMALIIVGLIVLSWVVRYPDVVQAPLYLTTARAPYLITPKINGRIRQILVHDNQAVRFGQTLAVMESSANYDEVKLLKIRVASLRETVFTGRIPSTFAIDNFTHLGELQPAFEVFNRTWTQMRTFTQRDYYQRRKQIINVELSTLATMTNKMQEQLAVLQKDMELGEMDFKSQKSLYNENVIPESDYRKANSQYLIKQLPFKQGEQTLLNIRSQISIKQNEMLELDKQYFELKSSFTQTFNTLNNLIGDWEINHLITAPAAGLVTAPLTLQTNQQVRVDSPVFFITPPGSVYYGIAKIPQQNSGKVKTGQKVIIKLAGYPFQEYGILLGVITEVTPLSESDNTYQSKIQLSRGLITSYQKRLQFRNGMVGIAEVVTDDVSLLNRILYNFRLALRS